MSPWYSQFTYLHCQISIRDECIAENFPTGICTFSLHYCSSLLVHIFSTVVRKSYCYIRLFIAITPVIVSLITYSITFLLLWHVIYLHESKSEDRDRFSNLVGSRGKKEEEHTQPQKWGFIIDTRWLQCWR